MNSKLRTIQRSAAADWAHQFWSYKDTCIVLQWLDDRDFDVPESFRFSLGNNYSAVYLAYTTGKERDLYEMNEMIQRTLHIVPTFDVDNDIYRFHCASITVPNSRLPLKITFGFDLELLDGLLGDFCTITRKQVPRSYSTEITEVECFAKM